MDMRADQGSRSRGRWLGAALISLILASAPGCASNQFGVRQDEEHPPKDLGTTPTLGADRSKVPDGQSIPPAGLGVDLVRGASGPGAGSAPA
jgi:hypothetical protein